ncbi:MAG: Tm-1-like ATP-binding domain-containing protein [Angelakisella sp.]|nr:Tm-1-like ATP-binding domain-containing protein [Angelakisella sp.]
MVPTVILVSTFDTKGVECEFIRQVILRYGAQCRTLDVGVGGVPTAKPDISLAQLCQGSSYTVDSIHAMPRGEAVAAVSNLVETYIKNLYENGEMACVAGIGGAGGTQIVTQAMRTLPFGLPKLMLSTLASGNTRWYMQDSDIVMIPSICDVSAINSITSLVYERFGSLCAMGAIWFAENFKRHLTHLNDPKAKRVALTMYGTTTKGVTRAVQELEKNGFEPIVFHASGAGGMSLERFARQGVFAGALEMTLAEIGAHLVGGLHDAGPNRLEAAGVMGLPQVIVPGGADTIVLPPMSALPEKFKEGRILNMHNPTMTTMRTNVEECRQIGEFMVRKLKMAKGPVKVLIPKGGLSSIDKPGEKFYFPQANKMLFHTLKAGLQGSSVEVIEDERHLYDPGFGELAAHMVMEMINAR